MPDNERTLRDVSWSFASDKEAFAEANRLPYGPAAYAFTTSAERWDRVASRIESGMIGVNHRALGLPKTSFGGVKDSEYGSGGGAATMNAYLDSRFVTLANWSVITTGRHRT